MAAGTAGPHAPWVRPAPAPTRRRPRLAWIGVAWLAFVLLTAAALAVAVAEYEGGATGPQRFFRDRVPVPVPPDGRPVVYVVQPGPDAIACELDGPDARSARLLRLGTGWTTWSAGQEWWAVYEVSRPPGTALQIACDGGDSLFGLGSGVEEEPSLGPAVALLLLPPLGLVAALATTIVVPVARRRPAPPPWVRAPMPLPRRRVRHPRRWVGASWVGVGVLVAVAASIYVSHGLGRYVDTEAHRHFRVGETITVTRSGAERVGIFEVGGGPSVDCAATGPDAERVELEFLFHDVVVLGPDGRQWLLVYEITMPPGREFRIRCDGGPAQLTIGREPDPSATTWISGLLALVLAGYAGALGVTVRLLPRS